MLLDFHTSSCGFDGFDSKVHHEVSTHYRRNEDWIEIGILGKTRVFGPPCCLQVPGDFLRLRRCSGHVEGLTLRQVR